jgi:hypothetical protein
MVIASVFEADTPTGLQVRILRGQQFGIVLFIIIFVNLLLRGEAIRN